MNIVFAALFFMVAFISLIFGIYTFSLSPKNQTNRLFFLSSISLGLWSLGFSFAILAPTADICLIWRRVSAIGWTLIFAQLLGLFMSLTGARLTYQKLWVRVIIYFPALFHLYIFSLSGAMAKIQYNLVMGPYGWTNIAVNNMWDYLYYIYYVSYLLIGYILIYRWGSYKHGANGQRHHQSVVLLISFIAAFFLGSLTDFVANALLGLTIPQMAPLFFLLPILSAYYVMRRYRFLQSTYRQSENHVISDANRGRFYAYIGTLFIIGGIVNLGFVATRSLYTINYYVITSIFLIIGGTLIISFYFLPIKEAYKQTVIAVVLSLFMPYFTLLFSQYTSVTVWAFPMVIIILFLLFEQSFMIHMMALSILITQLILWYQAPVKMVEINRLDYMGRLVIFLMAMLVAYFVNTVYKIRLEENKRQMNFQALTSKVSRGLLALSYENYQEKILEVVKETAISYQTRSVIIQMYDQLPGLSFNMKWYMDDASKVIQERMHTQLIAKGLKWEDAIKHKEYFSSIVDYLNPETSQEEKDLFLASPIVAQDLVVGYILMYAPQIKNIHEKGSTARLNILFNLFMEAINRSYTEYSIHRMAYFDSLTGLPNRRYINDLIKNALIEARKRRYKSALLYLDVDAFKTINDTLGHKGGDEFLMLLSERLKSLESPNLTIARYGGDEFILLIPHFVDKAMVEETASNLAHIFDEPFRITEFDFKVTSSIGIACYPDDGLSEDDLLKNADIAMYQAKFLGKNRYLFCNEAIKVANQEENLLKHYLYTALDNNELSLVYQPQINLVTNQIEGMEALIRWHNRELGFISPSRFIPIAEKTGMISRIGEWVIKTATAQNKAWQRAGLPHIPVSVNLSVAQFVRQDLVECVGRALKAVDLDPKYLNLEITESLTMNAIHTNVSHTLKRLQDMGLAISIDDFGVEYSSLSRLKELPVNHLKIDMQFIQGLDQNKEDPAITDAIIKLAKNLNLKVVAEGIETQAQRDFLVGKGCDYAQGYFYHKPLSTEDMTALLKEQI